ncbi:MAG: class I SAM-dependent methyltransferase [Solirubrobacteraceae bacterium]
MSNAAERDQSDTVSPVQAISRVASIPGWMEPGDADKLYELAGAADGPILEIGTYHGKSAVLMALAVKDAGRHVTIFTLEVDKAAIRAATAQAEAHGVAETIVFVRATADAFARAYPRLQPALSFVDGDHRRKGVEADLAVLSTVVPQGGRILFHDFVDPLNDDPTCHEIKVRPTVEKSWVAAECDFDGVYGGSGLYTRRTEPTLRPGPAEIDLMPLASPADQYLHRLRYPAGRVWKRLRGVNPRVPATTETPR